MIPRTHTKTVQDIINSDKTIKEKAQAIHDYDYDCCLRETDSRVYKWDITSVSEIEKSLDGSI